MTLFSTLVNVMIILLLLIFLLAFVWIGIHLSNLFSKKNKKENNTKNQQKIEPLFDKEIYKLLETIDADKGDFKLKKRNKPKNRFEPRNGTHYEYDHTVVSNWIYVDVFKKVGNCYGAAEFIYTNAESD